MSAENPPEIVSSVDRTSFRSIDTVHVPPRNSMSLPKPVKAARSVAPYNEVAEAALLGGAMLSESVLAVVAQEVEPEDFYLPRHQVIAAACRVLWQANLAADPVMVAEELRREGNLQLAGGTANLVSLVAQTPSTTNARSYARTVLDNAVRRRFIAAAAETFEESQDLYRSIEDLYISARKRFGTLDIPVIAGEPDADVETFLQGNTEYDWLIEGLMERTDRFILTGGEGGGKALALDTPLPTSDGWTTMKAIQPGDTVLAPNGAPTTVIAVTDEMMDRPCYEVVFSDGERIVADAEHLWRTDTYASRKSDARRRQGPLRPRGIDQSHKRAVGGLVTTAEMAATVEARPGFVNHSIPCAAPLDLSEADLPVDPYVLGAWLGDGESAGARMTSADPEVLDHFTAAGYEVTKARSGRYLWNISGLRGRLRAVGVLSNKHIPARYLRSSIGQRWALLQGLMDTDGYVDGRGHCEFTTTNPILAEGVHDLVVGLGHKARVAEGRASINGRDCGAKYRIAFRSDGPVFRLERKLKRMQPPKQRSARTRYVMAVRPVPSVPVKCIQVAAADGMYLAGRNMVPTHNSTLLRQFAVCAAAGIHPFRDKPMPPVNVLIVDAENSEIQTRRKLKPMVELARQMIQQREGEYEPWDPDRLRIHVKNDGLDLMQRYDVRWLMERLEANKPDLLIIGPLYKLHAGDPTDESPARHVARVIDIARHRYGCALMMEAHSPYTNMDGKRVGRPYGASLWSRWPEFGYCIAVADKDVPDEVMLEPWRGARDEREWPAMLRRGKPSPRPNGPLPEWPWREASN